MNKSLSPIPVFVTNSFLFNGDNIPGKTLGHLISVRALQNQALQFTVLLSNGALFTGLPAHAISFLKNSPVLTLQEAQMWDCISNEIDVFVMETLRYAECSVNINSTSYFGKYLFTIDFTGDGFSREPTHWKQLHVIQGDNGEFLLYPQYRLRFTDKALLENDEPLPKYKANTSHWIVGS